MFVLLVLTVLTLDGQGLAIAHSINRTLSDQSQSQAVVIVTTSVNVNASAEPSVSSCLDESPLVENYPSLQPISFPIEVVYKRQPMFVSFAPQFEASAGIDNICYTLERLPDDKNVYQLFISVVYCDGFNRVETYTVSQDTNEGIFTFGSPQCTFMEIAFDHIEDANIPCDVYIMYKNTLNGDCPRMAELPVFGLFFSQKPLTDECMDLAKQAIAQQGLPQQNYTTFPKVLPSKCVYAQPPGVYQPTLEPSCRARRRQLL